MPTFRLWLTAFLMIVSQHPSAQILVFRDKPEGPVQRFAMEELKAFLPMGSTTPKGLGLHVGFRRDTSLKQGAFAFGIRKEKKSALAVEFRGEGDTEILHAVHSFLEHLGYRFGISGPVAPERIRLDTLTSREYRLKPYTRWRGIRQHVNFPMDISSYPLEEAMEYLRNSVRLRFNKLAVHSYPNLWHEVRTGDSVEYAGNFFYNRRHDIPDISLFRERIRFNKSTYVIPSIEPFLNDRVARSRMSVSWMRDLLAYAKSIGLRIHFSVEPRMRGDIDYILDNCRSALRDYPMVDELEINTEELGGWGNACSDTAVRDVLVRRFGPTVLQDTMVTRVIRPRQSDLDNLIDQVGRNMEAVRRIRGTEWYRSRPVELKLGIYCVIPAYAGVAYHLVRKHMPEVSLSIMPGHGSVRTANHLAKVPIGSRDLERTTLFSWIEFDGLMFTQQNPVAGIEALFRQLDTVRGGSQLNAVLFNHWRTAESRVGARYAALSSLQGPIPSDVFYRAYAQDLGVIDTASFTRAMQELETIDRVSTDDLPNVGFCWIGAWLNGGPYMWMNREILAGVRRSYVLVGDLMEASMKSSVKPVGRGHLAFLTNRIRASELYLQAFEAASELQRIRKDSAGGYAQSDRRKAAERCDLALAIHDRYMHLHARLMPDRGCEGTLVNLWHGPVYGLKVLRERFAGIPMDAPVKPEHSTDAPPLPILIEHRP